MPENYGSYFCSNLMRYGAVAPLRMAGVSRPMFVVPLNLSPGVLRACLLGFGYVFPQRYVGKLPYREIPAVNGF